MIGIVVFLFTGTAHSLETVPVKVENIPPAYLIQEIKQGLFSTEMLLFVPTSPTTGIAIMKFPTGLYVVANMRWIGSRWIFATVSILEILRKDSEGVIYTVWQKEEE